MWPYLALTTSSLSNSPQQVAPYRGKRIAETIENDKKMASSNLKERSAKGWIREVTTGATVVVF
jgi:hypothetical protein